MCWHSQYGILFLVLPLKHLKRGTILYKSLRVDRTCTSHYRAVLSSASNAPKIRRSVIDKVTKHDFAISLQGARSDGPNNPRDWPEAAPHATPSLGDHKTGRDRLLSWHELELESFEKLCLRKTSHHYKKFHISCHVLSIFARSFSGRIRNVSRAIYRGNTPFPAFTSLPHLPFFL